MVNFDEIFERIKYATSTRTQVELAEVLDIRQSSISDAKRRNSVPSDWFMKLFEQFGLNPDWLKKGIGPMYLRTDQGYAPVDAPPLAMVSEEVGRYGSSDAKSVVVPVYSAACGEDGTPQVTARLSIPQSFSSPDLYVVRAASSAMEPGIQKDAYVGMDTSKRHVASGELYGVKLPYEGLVIKRVFCDNQNKTLLLRSEKPDHPEMTLPADESDKYIVGRVIWVMQHM